MSKGSEIAASIRSRSAIKDPESHFFATSGPKAAATIYERLKPYLPDGAHVLDFGCASGRVLIPLSTLAVRWKFDGCDVDSEAIDYVALQNIPNISVRSNGYAPPTTFDDASFDALYALSVWSHFPEKTARAWIGEVRRLLKPGGIAFITTAGPSMLPFVQKTFGRWGDVTQESIAREGYCISGDR